METSVCWCWTSSAADGSCRCPKRFPRRQDSDLPQRRFAVLSCSSGLVQKCSPAAEARARGDSAGESFIGSSPQPWRPSARHRELEIFAEKPLKEPRKAACERVEGKDQRPWSWRSPRRHPDASTGCWYFYGDRWETSLRLCSQQASD